MAAPQIPNLSSLRTGRGGWGSRGRGLSGPTTSSPEEENTARDKIVQHTDQDASVSRLSAVELGYLEDPFAKLFVCSESQRRFPIINRGTYVRTSAIDNLVDQFLSTHPSTKKQIISLGAGSDTRFFRLMRKDPNLRVPTQEPNIRSSLVYHEIDFSENTARKISIIHRSSKIRGILGTPLEFRPFPSSLPDRLDGPNYHIHPTDLRTLDPQEQTPESFKNIDALLPTLVISECCLVYLDPTLADKVAKYFTQFLIPPPTPLGLILYEPIKPHDAFGKVMVSNLAARGIVLQTLRKYGSLEAQAVRMKAYGLDDSGGDDVNGLWQKGVDEQEKARVAGLEMVDEVEEWELLAGHYCVVWGWRGGTDDTTWEGWQHSAIKASLR